MYTYPETVSEAATLLDKVQLGWHDKVNVDTFDMKRSELCILGQLYGDYAVAMEKLFGVMVGNPESCKYNHAKSFSYYADKTLWISEIMKRRSEDVLVS